jgi:hypothetical protein
MLREENRIIRTTKVAAKQCFSPALSHPDYDRRLRSCTESADPNQNIQALAACKCRFSTLAGAHVLKVHSAPVLEKHHFQHAITRICVGT